MGAWISILRPLYSPKRLIAISILVEGGAVLTGFVLVVAGRENIAVAQAISYAICAVIVSVGTRIFLSGRGVFAARHMALGASSRRNASTLVAS